MPISTQYLKEIDDKVGLNNLYRNGLINQWVIKLYAIRNKVDALMMSGKSKGQAVRHVADEMNITREMVYRYLRM